MIDVTFTLTERDVTTAQRSVFGITFFRRTAWRAWQGGAAFGAIVLLLICYLGTDTWEHFRFIVLLVAVLYVGVFLAMGVLLFVLAYAGSAKLAQRSMRKFKWLREPISARMDADRIYYGNAIGSSDCRWQAFTGWAENPQQILLLVDADRTQILPKRALNAPHDLDHIRTWLTEAGVPYCAPFC